MRFAGFSQFIRGLARDFRPEPFAASAAACHWPALLPSVTLLLIMRPKTRIPVLLLRIHENARLFGETCRAAESIRGKTHL